MVRTRKLSGLIGLIKDKASQSKAALIARPNILSFQLALLRATTHDPYAPPHPKHLSALLSLGNTSRATAAAAIEVLMDRLQTTHNSAVALKCLLAVHHIVNNGAFILQDQLSVFPLTGGRNYLKLSDFRHNSTPISWELSSWVRWYAQYIETLFSASRILGFFVGSSTSTEEREKKSEQISALLNSDLIREIESLVGLIEEATKRPHSLHLKANKLVDMILGFVADDYLSAVKEISVRVTEFHQRLRCLSFGESVELVCVLKRLEDCKEKQQLLGISAKYEILTDGFWGLIWETKNLIGETKDGAGVKLTRTTTPRMSDSGRFMERPNIYRDSLRFGSERFDFTCKRIPVVGVTEPYFIK